MYKVYDLNRKRLFALKIMKKEVDLQLENLLEEVAHEMKMTMEIMNINNKYFTNLIAF